jgi:hypothetical protein
MYASRAFRRSPIAAAVFVLLAGLIGAGVPVAVSGAFQRDGAPFEALLIAEHACAHYTYASDRERCIRAHVAASRRPSVASR